MPRYLIIPITEKYIVSFREAVGSIAREHKYLTFLDTPPPKLARTFVLENLRGNWPHFIALDNHRVVGWCDISSLHKPVFAHAGQLGVGVIAEYRGQGIGETLMRIAIEKAKSIGLTRIQLTVRENNKPAIALYKKFGFIREGFHKNAVRIDNQYENHISMALLFE